MIRANPLCLCRNCAVLNPPSEIKAECCLRITAFHARRPGLSQKRLPASSGRWNLSHTEPVMSVFFATETPELLTFASATVRFRWMLVGNPMGACGRPGSYCRQSSARNAVIDQEYILDGCCNVRNDFTSIRLSNGLSLSSCRTCSAQQKNAQALALGNQNPALWDSLWMEFDHR